MILWVSPGIRWLHVALDGLTLRQGQKLRQEVLSVSWGSSKRLEPFKPPLAFDFRLRAADDFVFAADGFRWRGLIVAAALRLLALRCSPVLEFRRQTGTALALGELLAQLLRFMGTGALAC